MLLLFAIILTYSGTSNGSSRELLTTLPQHVQQGHVTDNLSENKLFKFPDLQRSEQRVNAANNLPGAPFKKENSNDLSGSLVASELVLQNSTAAYIARSKVLNCGLRTSDIIFPFHYFW
ncbi:hypothetical protein ABID22_002831 [Pontibacter aydingkolensis]|uniref:Uncharacterized protein n=2 Tax=Pontibacter aydingkolensis TaxID=1911536 RepID=A0ABS7CX25_9BACT|nr:hypothetical protein [Pontibacter aydingkolensis]MBW7468419.1 hypothetical protein [Pontibacter aydingkolensis]